MERRTDPRLRSWWDLFGAELTAALCQEVCPPEREIVKVKDWNWDSEAKEMASELAGSSWSEFSSDYWMSAPIVFLTPQAYRYFAPGFLTCDCGLHEGLGVGPGLAGLLPGGTYSVNLDAVRTISSYFTGRELRILRLYVRLFRYNWDRGAARAWEVYWRDLPVEK